jgi:hypothetical protein
MDKNKPIYNYTVSVKPDYVYHFNWYNLSEMQENLLESALDSLNGEYQEAKSVLNNFKLRKDHE